MVERAVSITGGLATFGPLGARLMKALDDHFLACADTIGASDVIFPPVISVADLDRIDYFRSYPHQGAMITRVRPASIDAHHGRLAVAEVATDHLEPASLVWVPSTCYSIYLHHADTVLDGPSRSTARATCWRHPLDESASDLRAFTQRKFVFIGDAGTVQRDIAETRRLFVETADVLDLPVTVRPITDASHDPDPNASRIRRLFSADEEFCYDDATPLAHTNFHRRFYTSRCNIMMSDGSVAEAGCAGVVYEHWAQALLREADGDAESVLDTVASRLPSTRPHATEPT
jgi:hypothetical protein